MASTLTKGIASPAQPHTRDLAIQPPLVPAVLLLSPVLISAPTLLGNSVVVYLVTLAPLCAAILSLSLKRGDWRASNALLLALAYVALLVVAALRGHYFGTINTNAATLEVLQLTLLASLGMFAFLREPRAHQRNRYVRSLCWAPAVFVAVNAGLHAMGVAASAVAAQTGQAATMLGLIGIPAERVVFPLSNGFVAIGPLATAALVISLTLARLGEQRKLALVSAALSLYVILAIDSRGSLLFALLTLLILAIAPRARKRGLGWVAIALPVLPVLLVLALTGLAETEIGTKLNRRGADDISTGTGRTIVWREVTDVLLKPRVDSVFGYGQYGQITSRASVGYAYLFRGEADPLTRTAHSLLLQTALDIGWLGAACLIALIAAVLSRLASRVEHPLYAALCAAAVALTLLGVVQSSPTPIGPDNFTFWLLLVFAAVRSRGAD